jgi:hypothetical protein
MILVKKNLHACVVHCHYVQSKEHNIQEESDSPSIFSVYPSLHNVSPIFVAAKHLHRRRRRRYVQNPLSVLLCNMHSRSAIHRTYGLLNNKNNHNSNAYTAYTAYIAYIAYIAYTASSGHATRPLCILQYPSIIIL